MLPLTRSRNRARFFGTPFSPEALFAGGTVAGAWYDPSDLGTLFTTSAGTTQCAMPGQGSAVSVGRMLDKSGNGNHAIAFNDTTARPELRARVNLLTYSEEFDNGAWTNLNAATNIVANATTAPNGTNTADFFRVAATTNTDHLIRATNTVSVAASTYILTWRIKANGINRFRMAVASETSLANRAWVNVNLSTRAQTGGNDGSGFTFVSSDVTLEDAYGFQTVSLTYTTTVVTVIPYIVMQDASGNFTFAGTVDTGLYIWGADLRPANIGANVPAYQRIADANTYDTSGFPLYLRFDGIDDSMYTPANLNLSGTDKVSVFAGVRRNTTATMFPVELSAQASANNGAFAIGTDSGGFEYFFDSRGTALQQILIDNAAYNAPVTNVLTLSSDIAAPSLIARINSTQVGTNTSSQGSGNFGTYPLYIGARNNASFFFNGHLYSLIIAGSAVSAGNISATEQWVAGKTGLVLP